MPIKIADKKVVFSHEAGTYALIPLTNVSVTIFPCKIAIANKEIYFPTLKGPVDDFTIMQDLEKGFITVYGTTIEGYFRYRLFSYDNNIRMHFEKLWQPTIELAIKSRFKKEKISVKEKGFLDININHFTFAKGQEILSLGVNKTLDINLVQRRCDMKEILPLWLFIGSTMNFKEENHDGNMALLHDITKLIDNNQKHLLENSFMSAFKASFDGMFVPKLFDDKWLGILHQNSKVNPGLKAWEYFILEGVSSKRINKKHNPFLILQEGSKLIRKMFFQQDKDSIYILPALPTAFTSGKFINIKCNNIGTLHLQWSKGIPFYMIFTANLDYDLKIVWPRGIKTLRLRGENMKKKISALDNIKVKQGKTYLFDRFQK
jgi:hypothetical protein